MSTMSALSMLQEAQTARNIAAFQALANMRHEHDELRNSSAMSPPSLVGASLQNEPANFYANLFGASPHLGLLTPQMIAANQFNTAALLSKLYPHPLLSWQMPPLGTAASPPISPTSPISVKNLKKLNNNSNNNNNNNIVSTTTNEEFINNNYKLNIGDDLNKHDETNTYTSIAQSPTTGKKTTANRKSINYRKKRTTSLFQPYAKLEPSSPLNTELAVSPGPISPPTSGSSPQSIGSIEHQSPSSSSVAAAKETTTRDKTFTCQTCNRSFGYKHVLQNHERTHTGEKPYACPICSKRFTRDHHLKTHMRLHTGEKPYSCDFCDRQFVQVANLRRHLRVHTGEKPYTCPVCSSKFSDSNQLKAHSIVHQDEKPYRCQTCDASFRRSHHLVNHKCPATVNNSSPLTPAMSPVMSMDTKSIASRSDVSQDDLLDLSAQSAALIKNLTLNFNHYHQSHNGNSNNNNNNNNNKPTSNMVSPHIKHERYKHQANDNNNDYSDAQDMPLDLSIDSSNSDNGKNRSDSV